MPGLQFQPVETGLHGTSRGGHEVLADARQFLVAGLGRDLRNTFQIGQRTGRNQRPVARRQRTIRLLPAELGGAAPARVIELQADACLAVGVDHVDHALPALLLFLVPQAGAARRHAAFGTDGRGLGEQQADAAQRTRTQMHQMEVARYALACRIQQGRRGDHAIVQRQLAHLEGRQQRRRGARAIGGQPGTLGQPAFIAFQPLRITQAQVLVRDALRAGQQGIGKLFRFQVFIAGDVLEPFGGVARRILDLQDFHPAHRFISLQTGAQTAFLFEHARQFDGVLQRQLGAGADGEVRRVGRIAHEHHRHLGTGLAVRTGPLHPLVADHAREADPDGRAAQVGGIGDELLAIEPRGEQFFAEGHTVFLRHLVDAGGLPGGIGGLDDEGGQAILETIGMRLEPAVFGRHEDEGEGIEDLARAQPDEAAIALVDVGTEGIGIAGAHGAVDAVAGDEQVGLVLARDLLVILHLGFKDQFHTEFFAACLQDVEQALAADADETVAAAADDAALEMHVDVIPAAELAGDGGGRYRIGLAQVVQRGIREHHAPAEGVIGTIALDHHYAVRRVLQFHQQTEIQAGGTAADTDDVHVALLCCW